MSINKDAERFRFLRDHSHEIRENDWHIILRKTEDPEEFTLQVDIQMEIWRNK